MATDGQKTGLANDGFWGVPVYPSTNYKGSFYAMTNGNSAGPIAVDIESINGSSTFATAEVSGVGNNWKKFTFNFTTSSSVTPTAATQFCYQAIYQRELLVYACVLVPSNV